MQVCLVVGLKLHLEAAGLCLYFQMSLCGLPNKLSARAPLEDVCLITLGLNLKLTFHLPPHHPLIKKLSLSS